MLALVLLLAGSVGANLIHRTLREVILHDHAQRIDQIALSFLSRLLVLAMWLLLATAYAHLVPALNRLGSALLAGVALLPRPVLMPVPVLVDDQVTWTLQDLAAGRTLTDPAEAGLPPSWSMGLG